MSSAKPDKQNSVKRSRFSFSKKKKKSSIDKAASVSCIPEAADGASFSFGDSPDDRLNPVSELRFDRRETRMAAEHERQMAEMQQRLDEAQRDAEALRSEAEKAPSAEEHGREMAEMQQRLGESQQEVSNWRSRATVDQETITQLDAKVQGLEIEAKSLRTKVDTYEKVEKDLDDESFAASQEFQLKKQLTELQERNKKLQTVDEDLVKAKAELTTAKAELEEMRMQRDRSQTRSKIQSISGDKSAEANVTRLQKELRTLERKLQMEASQYEAKLKASKDSLERAQEKAVLVQKKTDLIDKERLELKIANSRLEKKLEKADTYGERRRSEMERESQELEIRNLKRKNSKLAKRLSMTGVDVEALSNISTPVSSRPPSSMDDVAMALYGLANSPIPEGDTVAEARIGILEKEVSGLQARAGELAKENKQLKADFTAAGQTADRTKQLEEEIASRDAEIASLKTSASLGEGEELQRNYKKMEKRLTDKETEFRVKEKDLRATIEDLKRQYQELEIEKIKLELGEDEDGEGEDGDLTDTEDNEEMQELKERVKSVQAELDAVKLENTELTSKIETGKQEMSRALEEMASMRQPKATPSQESSGELAMENDELKQRLAEQTTKYDQAMSELAKLKETTEQQDDEFTLLKVQSQMLEQKAADAERREADAEESVKEAEQIIEQTERKLAEAILRANGLQSQLAEIVQEDEGKRSMDQKTKTPPPPVVVKKSKKESRKSISPEPIPLTPSAEEKHTSEPVESVDGPAMPVSNGQSDGAKSPVKEASPSPETVLPQAPSPQKEQPRRSPDRDVPTEKVKKIQAIGGVKLMPVSKRVFPPPKEDKSTTRTRAPKAKGGANFHDKLAMFQQK